MNCPRVIKWWSQTGNLRYLIMNTCVIMNSTIRIANPLNFTELIDVFLMYFDSRVGYFDNRPQSEDV